MAKAKRSFLPEKHVPKTVQWLWANEAFEERYPALYELLASGVFEGETRRGATLTLFVSDGRLKASITDRQTEQVVYVVLEPLDDVLAEVEAHLVSSGVIWTSTRKNGAKPVF